MNHRSNLPGRAVALAWLLSLALGALDASAQATTTRQILDRVDVYNTNAILEMAFANAVRPPDFTKLPLTGTAISTCTLAPTGGMYCLDGKIVRNWPNVEDPLSAVDKVNCADPVLGLDTRKPDTCTGMAVNLAGAVWIAGKKANTHSVIKVIAKGAACPDSSWSTLTGGLYCAKEYYAGRPLLVDIESIDGDIGAAFKPCPTCAAQNGVLGLEERKTAVFFPDPKASSPIVVVGSKDWGLNGSESLLSATVLQVTNNSVVTNYILAVTSNGRVLSKNLSSTGPAVPVFDVPSARLTSSKPATQCAFSTQNYGIRASSKAGTVYVTDKNFCQVMALVPNGSPLSSLVRAVTSAGEELTLSTSSSAGTFAPDGPTIAPGINIDLKDCNGSCTLVATDTGKAAATLSAVSLASTQSGAVVFQIKGIPDCRYAAKPTFPAAQRDFCARTPGVVINPDGSAVTIFADGSTNSPFAPAAQRLNVTPLLPKEVTSLFDASGVPPKGLPALQISRQYRGQARTSFVFEALFVVVQPGVRFRNVFDGEFDVPALQSTGASLGCVPNLSNLIAWDVSTTVSETYKTLDGQYVDMINNTGCGTTKTQSGRLSLLPYNLEIAPDTYGPTILSPNPSVTFGNDAVFARLVQSLYDDLEYVRRELACKQVDPVPNGGTPPLTSATCNNLAAVWANGKTKLDKCILAAFQPKQSAGDENCQSFVSQLTNYQNSLPVNTASQDVANRLGELTVRTRVIRHVFDTRFLPSIPATGFCRESNPSTCPAPWQ